MVRDLPSSNNSKFSGFRSEMGMPVFLSLTSASRKTTRVRILIVSETSWAKMVGAAIAKRSRNTLRRTTDVKRVEVDAFMDSPNLPSLTVGLLTLRIADRYFVG